jgi:fumarate reductase flavoprotein subunit
MQYAPGYAEAVFVAGAGSHGDGLRMGLGAGRGPARHGLCQRHLRQAPDRRNQRSQPSGGLQRVRSRSIRMASASSTRASPTSCWAMRSWPSRGTQPTRSWTRACSTQGMIVSASSISGGGLRKGLFYVGRQSGGTGPPDRDRARRAGGHGPRATTAMSTRATTLSLGAHAWSTDTGELRRIETAPFYAYPSTAVVFGTYCGLRIDSCARVLARRWLRHSGPLRCRRRSLAASTARPI